MFNFEDSAHLVFLLIWPAASVLSVLVVFGLYVARFISNRCRRELEEHGAVEAACHEDVPGTARPQVLLRGEDTHEVWPHHWGITLEQCKRFLAECQADPAWSADNTLYHLVEQYAKPRTAGTGMGLALLVNQEEPLEVNVMVSHAWSENAEEFFKALELTLSDDDVVFICALSLYQCPDACGPSIAQQLGSSAAESPFNRVLQHICRRGRGDGVLWRWGEYLWMLPALHALLALTLLCGPVMTNGCVPTLGGTRVICSYSEEQDGRRLKFKPDAMLGKWSQDEWALSEDEAEMELSYEFVSFLSAAVCAACSVLVAGALRFTKAYRGRMVVVPNRQCDIYTRLWCVYEIFIARTLAVPVVLAHTLARASSGNSRSAKCGNQDDMDRIRAEIENHGVKVCGDADKGYTLVDGAIKKMKRSMRFSLCVPTVLQFWPVMLVQVSWVRLCVDAPMEYGTYWAALAIFSFLLAAVIVAIAMYRLAKRTEGRVRRRGVYMVSSVFVIVGIALTCLLIFVADAVVNDEATPAAHFILPPLLFGTTLVDSGLALGVLTLANRLFHVPTAKAQRVSTSLSRLAWYGQLAALTMVVFGASAWSEALTLGFYMVIVFSFLGFVATFLTTAQMWDIRFQKQAGVLRLGKADA